ncbi:unnamed protein product [Peniophora sp. CBMAI 1063]|nr:unnamed protein product [Peniophora sp. CBMAI 1063]
MDVQDRNGLTRVTSETSLEREEQQSTAFPPPPTTPDDYHILSGPDMSSRGRGTARSRSQSSLNTSNRGRGRGRGRGSRGTATTTGTTPRKATARKKDSKIAKEGVFEDDAFLATDDEDDEPQRKRPRTEAGPSLTFDDDDGDDSDLLTMISEGRVTRSQDVGLGNKQAAVEPTARKVARTMREKVENGLRRRQRAVPAGGFESQAGEPDRPSTPTLTQAQKRAQKKIDSINFARGTVNAGLAATDPLGAPAAPARSSSTKRFATEKSRVLAKSSRALADDWEERASTSTANTRVPRARADVGSQEEDDVFLAERDIPSDEDDDDYEDGAEEEGSSEHDEGDRGHRVVRRRAVGGFDDADVVVPKRGVRREFKAHQQVAFEVVKSEDEDEEKDDGNAAAGARAKRKVETSLADWNGRQPVPVKPSTKSAGATEALGPMLTFIVHEIRSKSTYVAARTQSDSIYSIGKQGLVNYRKDFLKCGIAVVDDAVYAHSEDPTIIESYVEDALYGSKFATYGKPDAVHPTESIMSPFVLEVFARAHLARIRGSVHAKTFNKEPAIGAIKLSVLAVQKAFELWASGSRGDEDDEI